MWLRQKENAGFNQKAVFREVQHLDDEQWI